MRKLLVWALIALSIHLPSVAFAEQPLQLANVTLAFPGPGVYRVRTGSAGIAPTLIQNELIWDNANTTSRIIPASAPTGWSASIGDVLVMTLTFTATNNTDNLAGSTFTKIDGTGASSGGFSLDYTSQNHTGAESTIVAFYSAVVTGAGTFQFSGTGGTLDAGTTLRNMNLQLWRGMNTSGSRIDGTPAGANFSASPATSATVTSTGAAAFISAMSTDNSATYTISNGFTEPSGANTITSAMGYKTSTTAATTGGVWTMSGPVNGFAATIAYKSATP